MVWERNTPKKRNIKRYQPKYFCYELDPDGQHTSIFNDKLTKREFNSRYEMSDYVKRCPVGTIFESDVLPELRVLSDNYYEVAAPVPNITFLDIEVDYDKTIGFSSVIDPYAPINAVAMYHSWRNVMILFVVPPKADLYKGDPSDLIEENLMKRMNDIVKLPDDTTNLVEFCVDERALLDNILWEIENSDIISGWNSDFFDVPYIGKRLLALDQIDHEQAIDGIGNDEFGKLSFNLAPQPKWREVIRFGTPQFTLDLGGRVSLDYLELFKKYEMAERPSYKLEAISDEVLPNLPKLEYEGSLADLYINDLPWFCRYNFRDTEILKGFEDKLGYVELANQMVHLSTGLFKHVGGTLKLAELATINFCHHTLDKIVNNVPVGSDKVSIKGAFVLIPQVGMHSNIGSVDLNSLYPSAIRSINISPETLIGQFTRNIKDAEAIANNSDEPIILMTDSGEVLSMPATKWKSVLFKQKWAVSGYGTVFDQNVTGIIPSILDTWYATRKTYQKKMVDAKNDGNKELAEFYDRLQYVYKIKLNSFYGALTNAFFRFYDTRMGESTTGTGRAILLHQCAQTVKEITGEYALPDRVCIRFEKGKRKGEYEPATPEQLEDPDESIHYGYSNKYPIIYGDTDSTYFSIDGDDENIIPRADEIGSRVNDSFPEFMRTQFMCQPGFDQIIKTGREVVSDRGIFVDKKRYMLHITDDEGFSVDKVKVMGLETKKSTMSKNIAKNLNRFMERLLKGEDWNTIAPDVVQFKETLQEAVGSDCMALGLMKGIKGIEDYTKQYQANPKCFLPGHVAAAIHFNEKLIMNNDKESLPIKSGDKIKIFYILLPFKRFKTIAISGDIDQVPDWFTEQIVPIIDVPALMTRLVDKPLGNIIKAIGLTPPSKQSLFVDSLLEL